MPLSFRLTLGCLLTAASTLAHAQAFTPPAAATSTQTMPYSDLVQSQSIDVDAAGNLYFSRPASGILAVKPAGGGSEITLYTLPAAGGGYPKGVATNGTNAYLTDYSGHLWQVPVGGGAATDILPACNTLDGYYLGTQEVATDGQGNVYTAGNNETKLFKINNAGVCSVIGGVTLDANSRVSADAAGDLSYSTGGVLYSLPVGATTPVAVPATFNNIIGVRADAAGDVFVTTYSGIVEVPFIAGALDGTRAFTVLGGSSQNDVAVGADGSLYTTDGTNIFRNVLGSAPFPSTAVGSAAASQVVNVVFSSAQVLTSISYRSGTGVSAEFTDSGADTCAVGVAYTAGATCTLGVVFTPSALGLRSGAVVLSSATGPIGAAFTSGRGSGAGLAVDPATQAALGSGWQSPSGISVSANGGVLVADKSAGTLSYIQPGTTTATTIATGIAQPIATALAADGTAYVATAGGTVVQVPFSGTTYGAARIVITGLQAPSGLVVDRSGNLYVANTGAATVLRYATQSGQLDAASVTTIGNGWKSPAALGVGPDASLYVADSSAGTVTRIAGSATSVVVSGLTSPTGVALDDSGSMYVLQTGSSTVLRVPFNNGSYNTNLTTNLGSGLTTPIGLAVDGGGNLYLADAGAPAVVELQRSAGLLNLGRVNLGESSNGQSFTFSNSGDTALSLSSPFYTASGDTGDFAISTSGSNACSAGGSLGTGLTCSLSSTFTPTASGARTATLTLASSAVGSAKATLSGIGINLPKTTLTLTTTPAGNVSFGTSIMASATVAVPSGATTAPTGTVTFFVNGAVYGTVTLTGATVSVNISALPAGSNIIDATYSGDTNYAGSAGATQTLSVTLAPTATTLTGSVSSTTSVAPGTSITLSATVTSAVTSSKPTGSVTFLSGTTVLATAPVTASTGVASVSTTTLPTGTYSVTAVYGGDSGFAASTSNSIALSIRAPQYDVTGTPTTLTVSTPGSVTTTFNVVPISGYTGGVDLACSGLPANTSCTFLPAVVAFNGTTTPQSVQLTVTTSTAPATTVAAWLLPLGSLLLGGWRKRKSIRSGALTLSAIAILTGAGLLTITGCGSSTPKTPKGSSTITVNLVGTPDKTTTVPATGTGNILKTFTFNLNVQ